MGKVVLKFFFLIFIAFAGIGYDISSHGSLESSRTGRYLKDAGLLVHVKPYYSVIEEQTVALYKWGKKNFPYEEYATVKNKTVEVSKEVGRRTFILAHVGVSKIKEFTQISTKWVSERVTPYLSDNVIKFLNNISNAFGDLMQSFVKSVFNARKWCIENIKRENVTWENFEKAYFSFAQQIKIYYSNVHSWVSRKCGILK